MLRLGVPARWFTDPSPALRAWGGQGAIALYDSDPAIRAMLVERCVPGTDAADLSDAEADDAAVEVLERLWSSSGSPESRSGVRELEAAGVEPLGELCRPRLRALQERARSYAEIPGAELLDAAVRAYRRMLQGPTPPALVHGDFHRRNLLRSERGWLAIDPEPRIGDRTFDVALFLQHDLDRTETLERAERIAARLPGISLDRLRGWLLAIGGQAASWHLSIDDRETFERFVPVLRALDAD